MRVKFTERSIASLKPKPGKPGKPPDTFYVDRDIPGLYLRVRPGSRNWLFQYKVGGRSRKIAIGCATLVSFATAKETAGKYHAQVKLGRDPAAERIEAVAARALNVKELVDRYTTARQGEWKRRTREEIDRYLLRQLKPLHDKPVTAVELRDVAGLLTAVEAESGPTTANRMRAALLALWAWARAEGLCTTNPIADTRKRAEAPRDRVLSEDELRLVWLAAGDDRFGVIVKLLLLTGCRLREIAHLRWDEVDFDRNVIEIKAERIKNGRAHRIPLTSTMRTLLDNRSRESAFVFGQAYAGRDVPFGSFERYKRILDGRIRDLDGGRPIPDFVLHDLRRAIATHLSEQLNIAPHIVEALLNHQSGAKRGVAGIYNRASYWNERVAAATQWDTHIDKLVDDDRRDNVIRICA